MSSPSREKELIDMVIRLTSAQTPDVTQLYTQAKTIQELSRQRDFIIKEVAEERARWEAERHGFDRVAEALIAGRSHGGDSTYREEELERQVANLDADNKALRQKLSEYHVRVQSVEAELAQLRPVLLMQPYALTHSFSPSHDHYLHSPAHKADITRRVKRRKQGDQDQEATEEEPDTPTLASSSTPRAKPRGDYYRRRDMDQFGDSLRHRKRTQKKGGATLADARAEHVLLAARRVGRERASILAAGSGSPGSRDKEDSKKDTGHTDATPKTPRKHQTMEVGNGSTTGVIYLNSPIPAMADTASAEHVSSDFSPARTPLSSRKSSRNNVIQERVARNNPLTSLDSLLTAASTISMIEEKDGDGEDGDGDIVESDRGPSTSTRASTRRSPVVAPASPVPTKRRRLASSRLTRSLTSVTASTAKALQKPREGHAPPLTFLPIKLPYLAHRSTTVRPAKVVGKDDGACTSGINAESNSIGDSGRQKHPSRNRASQTKDQSSSRLLSTSTSSSSPSAQPGTETTRSHGLPQPPASETQGSTSPPKHLPPRSAAPVSGPSLSTELSQGTVTTTPKDASSTDSTRTSSAVKGAP
ncbi:hypothetical protein EI94DRAFT_422869 [Lactarius quietus]|nr:hypothetical protein EI94DRAFT_422869 [Lactarius quietus]